MSKFKYTPEQLRFLQDNVAAQGYRDLMLMFNRHFNREVSTAAIKSICYHYGWKNGLRKPQKPYTPEQLDFLKINIIGREHQELRAMFNKRFKKTVSLQGIIQACRRRGWKNGLKRKYKKNHHPHNWKVAGSETVGACGTMFVKMADAKKWKRKHHIIWEKAHGPIPKDHIVIFADGNKQNFKLDNLALIAREKYSSKFLKMANERTRHKIGAEKFSANKTILVKIAEPDIWRLKHWLIWEEVNGPVPGGHVLIFKDGNKHNYSLDNLRLISRREASLSRYGFNVSWSAGSERIDCEGYIQVKMPDGFWKYKQQLVWMAANGSIPENHMICFADSNRKNCRLDNLVLMARDERSYLNAKGLIFDSADLTRAALNMAKVGLKLNKLRKSVTVSVKY